MHTPRPPFPWFSMAAPILGSLVMWLVTRQPTVLLFALLGPLAMLASRWDARRSLRAQRDARPDGQLASQPQATLRAPVEPAVTVATLQPGEILLGHDAEHRPVVADAARLMLSGEVPWRASFERYLREQGWVDSAQPDHASVMVTLTERIGLARAELGQQEVSIHCRLLAATQLEQPGRDVTAGAVAAPVIDLVANGPHAWVMGMTGSGKTEFLIGWVLEMAAWQSPDELGIMLIDFKGGGSYRTLTELPQVLGLVTDLDAGEASRVLCSLSVELRRRERLLHEAAVGHIEQLPQPQSRLIVLVDEYRAMLDAFPEMRAVFVDIAARGRALGVHLILASQRASGAAGDALLANCALRISMRLTDALESQLVLGSPHAAQLAHVPGRGLAVGTQLPLTEFQSPFLTTEEKTERIRELRQRHHSARRQWRPWLPPLPAQLAWPDDVQPQAGEALLGLGDDLENQAQPWLSYAPARDGQLLILGPSQSGKSSAARMISAQLPGSSVHDDLDLQLAQAEWQVREQLVQQLTARLREPATADRCVIICWPSHVTLPAWLESCRARLSLGVELPGRAVWAGLELQLLPPG